MRRFIKKAVVLFLYWSGINWLLGRFLCNRAYLIGYHSVAENAESAEIKFYPKVTLLKNQLEDHLSFLKNSGHTFISAADLTRAFQNKVKKPTVIFFDDGFKNVLTTAWPVLKKYQAPLSIFLTVGYIEGDKIPEGIDGKKHPELFLNWEEVSILGSGGAVIGSHGLSHCRLTECQAAALSEELLQSKTTIEKKTDQEVNFLSYPSGRFDRRVMREAKRTGYSLAITTVEGIFGKEKLQKEPLSLPRVAPKPYDSLVMFKVKVYAWNLIKESERLLW